MVVVNEMDQEMVTVTVDTRDDSVEKMMERDSEMEIEMMELFEDLTLEDIVANKACVGKIMGCKNMAASVVKKILLGIWNLEDGWRMKKFEEGVLGFFFESEADCSFVLNKRPWLVNGVLLNIKPWPLEGEVRLSEFELARFWVEFHGLPTRCLSENNIPILAKKVGQLVKSDGKSKEETTEGPSGSCFNAAAFKRERLLCNEGVKLIGGNARQKGSWKRRPLPVQKEAGEGSSQATAVPDRSAGKMEGTEEGTLHGALHGSGRPLCSKDDDMARREGKTVVPREFENPPREECLNIPPKNILTELPTPDFASVGHENELGLIPDIGPSLIQSLNIPHIWTCKSQMPHHFPEPINFKWPTNDPQLQKLYCDLLGPDYTNLYKVQPSLISNPPNVSEMIVHLLGSRKRKAHTCKTDGEGEEVAGESFKAGTSRGNPRGRRKKGETCSSFLKRTKLGYHDFCGIPAIGIAGGFCLAWKKGLKMIVRKKFNTGFECQIEEENKAVWTMFFMYGTPYGREKNAFWQWFSTLVMKCESNWVVCGDLNVIAEASEKRGGYPRCTGVIQRAWSKQCYGQAGIRVCGKLRNTKNALKVWNRDVFGFCDQQLKSLYARLSFLQSQVQVQTATCEEEAEIQLRIIELEQRQERIWRQKSRELWVAIGDCNSKFFHTATLIRRRRNSIRAILDDGQDWILDRAGIGEYFTRKFRGLYQSQNPRFDQDFELGYVLERDKLCDLCGEIPENEVHLFRDCHFARCLWFSSPWGIINSNLGSLSFEDWFLWLVDTGNDSIMMFGACVMEHIWQCRNKLLFQGVKPNLTMSIRQLWQRFNEFKEILLDECKLTLTTTVNTCSGVIWDLHVRVDASVLDGMAGISVVEMQEDQDEGGVILQSEVVENVLAAELLAIFKALSWAVERKARSVISNGDDMKDV
ncbi:hypothetical protein G4B88_022236 [Cannabis sativa]|uniref:DUF4283 domain-containing protein n=1 Tax=Cannabis sativa TaxID=3483 RepID=A0A7J6G0Q3_CANSA|nr:hypothetical protein G4B88_022236 [Cannabis sativa]